MNQQSPDSAPNAPALSPDDQALLDALVEHDFDPAAIADLSPEQTGRARMLVQVFALMNDYPVNEPDDILVDATLARIDREDASRMTRLKLDPAEARTVAGGRGFRLPDLISIAAGLLIVASVAIPILTATTRNAQVAGCAENLRTLGQAFASYASDNDAALPVRQASLASGVAASWDQVRNFINLRPLVENGYCDSDHLNCPGHHGNGPSYSFQWQDPNTRATWDEAQPSRIFVGDQNPLIEIVRTGRAAPALSVSINHGGRGQNILRIDNSTQWLDSPVVDGDNIWLPGDNTELRPGIVPTSDDTFLTH